MVIKKVWCAPPIKVCAEVPRQHLDHFRRQLRVVAGGTQHFLPSIRDRYYNSKWDIPYLSIISMLCRDTRIFYNTAQLNFVISFGSADAWQVASALMPSHNLLTTLGKW